MAQKSWKIEEVFPRFVNAQMAKGVSDKTVLTYNRHFHSLGYHLDMTMTFDELTKEALDSMLVSLRKSGVSPNTISSYARVFRTFLKWCRAEGYTDLSLPNIPDKETVKGSYTDEELIALLKKPPKDCDFCEYQLLQRQRPHHSPQGGGNIGDRHQRCFGYGHPGLSFKHAAARGKV